MSVLHVSTSATAMDEAYQGETPDKKFFVGIKQKCHKLRKSHQVKPGRSWGSMNVTLQDLWMKMKCDEYFCKKNAMAGRGVYNCEPLS